MWLPYGHYVALRGGTGCTPTHPKEVQTNLPSQDAPMEKYTQITPADSLEPVLGLQRIFGLDMAWIEKILWSKYKQKRRPPHPPLAMFKAMIYQRLKQIQSWRKLASTLEADPNLATQLGFKKPPCFDSFSEFALRIGDETLNEIFVGFVNLLREELPDLGTHVVAVDGTLVRGYTRPRCATGQRLILTLRWE